MFAKYHHLLTTTRTSTAAAAAVGIAVLLVGTDSRETDSHNFQQRRPVNVVSFKLEDRFVDLNFTFLVWFDLSIRLDFLWIF